MPLHLTPQQQAVVDHTHGPALVFAVAGAGKTTALEYRIARLVRDRLFAPDRILAAAYNKAAQEELQRRLRQHPGCDRVAVQTLHALGLGIVRRGQSRGLLPHLSPRAFDEFDGLERLLLYAALGDARAGDVAYARELTSLNEDDFLTWLTACKGNLRYPSLDALPPAVRVTGLPTVAIPPRHLPWYADLYARYERIRQTRGLLTFDDQVLLAWELLVTHPDLRHEIQARYDCVLVDEFQDVNLAQSQILKNLVAPHGNYMAIGDDDQTIYEWRGARPEFLLAFDRTYRATRYYMTENFRCRLGAVVLANEVIRHNRHRVVKALHLTQGVDGAAEIIRSADRTAMGAAIAAQLRALHAHGERYHDMVILVRSRSQTPPVEMALIAAGIPYRPIDDQPFYQRWEIVTLIDYCRLAYLVNKVEGGSPLSATETARLADAWENVYRHPTRYISREIAAQILPALLGSARSPAQVLQDYPVDADWLRRGLDDLAADLRWLAGAFNDGPRAQAPAQSVLQQLDTRLGYTRYLEDRRGASGLVADEAENVRQFIAGAARRGNLAAYLQEIAGLDAQRAAHAQAGDRVPFSTIHSAKGLEWPVVILPSVDDGNLPHHKAANQEEERRLLYVAITRARRDLFIYHLEEQPSTFLAQTNAATHLHVAGVIRRALAKSPTAWTHDEIIALAISAPQLELLTYLQRWHPWSPAQRRAAAGVLAAFYARVQALDLATRLRLNDAAVAYWRDQAQGAPLQELPAPLAQWLAQQRPRAHTVIRPRSEPPAPRTPQPPTPSSARRAATPPPRRPARSTQPAPRSPHAPLQAFDQVRHAVYGIGEVVSTSTTAAGVVLKIRFANPPGLTELPASDPRLHRLDA